MFPRHIEEYSGVLNLGGKLDAEPYRSHAEILEAAGLPLIDHFSMTPRVDSAQCRETYQAILAGVPCGLSFLAFHCTAPGEIEQIIRTDTGWHPRHYWRTNEYHLFRDASFLDWMNKQNLHPIGMRVIRDWWRSCRNR
jgi:hypothetical protein